MSDLPDRVSVVIVGGGIVGCSLAYHLTLKGVSDVIVLEQHELTAGTTWHAAGLVGQLRATQNLTQLAQYTTQLFATLEEETGSATGFRRCGSVSVATTDDRFEELKRQASMARLFGLEVHEVGRDEILAAVPHINVDDVVGGVVLPGDGVVNPVDVTLALAKGARMRGATIREHTRVTQILTEGGRAVGVECASADGSQRIAADQVVVTSGMWSRELGRQAGANLPLHAAEHFYIVTDLIPGLPADMPVLRDPDACAYFKSDAGKLLVGWFEPVSKPWAVAPHLGGRGIPDGFAFETLPEDLDHVAPLLERAAERMPLLQDTGIQLFFNGPESFTPDDRYLLGETPEVKGLFVACGFNSIGIQSSGGAGKVLADWMVDGAPPMDLWDVDVRRMMPFQGNAEYLRDRTVEALGLLYAMHWPFRQPESARGVRRSPLHDRLAAQRACFGETAGWERPNWFAPDGVEPVYEYSYTRPNWLEHSGREHRAAREQVGLFDYSSFAKFQVVGPDAAKVLGRICANDVDVPVGSVVYTQWLGDKGTIEADLTVTREAEDRYLVVTAAATQMRDFVWLSEHIPSGASCWAFDVTSSMAVLAVMGPNSRDLLQGVTGADLSNEAFPFGTSQHLELGYATVRASRLSYVGELGWELYMGTEFAAHVYDRLVAAGDDHGLTHCGFHALNSLRMEKGYVHWGDDVTPDDDPVEAGLGFAVAWDKPGGFIGREALVARKAAGTGRRRIHIKLPHDAGIMYHNEPIWCDGEVVGQVTSGMFGHTVGGPVGIGYVTLGGEVVNAAALNARSFEVEVASRRYPAEVSVSPFYDPKSEHLKM